MGDEDPVRAEKRKRPKVSAISDVFKFTDSTFSFRNAKVPNFVDSESESEDDGFLLASEHLNSWQKNESIDILEEDEEDNYEDSVEIKCSDNEEEDAEIIEKRESSLHLRRSPTPPPEVFSESSIQKILHGKSKASRELDNVLLSLQQAASASVISPVPSTRQQGVINVDDSPTIISDSAERTLTVKIRMRSGIRKLQMKAGEPFGRIIIQLAKQQGVAEENIMLSLRDTNILGYDTPLSVRLSVADIIECVIMESKSTTADEESDENIIEIKVQGSDNASKKTFKVSKLESLERLMNEYCKHRNLSRKKVVFSFDGDELNGKETPEELDMEDENVIDVRTK